MITMNLKLMILNNTNVYNNILYCTYYKLFNTYTLYVSL